MNVWVLVANASMATLYETNNIYQGPLTALQQFSHPESREKGEDLVSDRSGNYREKNSPGSAFERADPKKLESEKFARLLGEVIKKGHAEQRYDRLIIVAASHFYGLLKKHLPKILKLTHLNKEYVDLSEKELLTQINQQ